MRRNTYLNHAIQIWPNFAGHMKLLLILILCLAVTIPANAQRENRNLVFDSSDLKILQRADAILSDSTKWNRQDDRQCDDDIASGKYSLYCALYKASIDVTGTYIHAGQPCRW